MPSQPFAPVPERVPEGRSWWKLCCTGCCLGFVVLLVLVPIALSFAFRGGPQQITSLPENFPSSLQLFRPEEATEMMYYPAASKNAVAKWIETPLAWLQNMGTTASSSTVSDVGDAISARLRRLEGRDTVAVRWSGLQASRTEMLEFYRTSLRSAGFAPLKERSDAGLNATEYFTQRANMQFSLLVLDEPSQTGLESVSVVVEYAVE